MSTNPSFTSCSKWTKKRRINKNVEEHMRSASLGVEGTTPVPAVSSRISPSCVAPPTPCNVGLECLFSDSASGSRTACGARPPCVTSTSESSKESKYNLDPSLCPSTSRRSNDQASSSSLIEEQGQDCEATEIESVFAVDEQENHCDVESLSSSSDTDDEVSASDSDLNYGLATWASGFNIPFVAVASLLSVLRPFHPSLPKDPRSLLNTPRNCAIKSIADGSYFHFGIVDSVSKVLQNCSTRLDGISQVYMQVNIDGLPLFKSSNAQFWPILGKISLPFQTDPFIIGLFSGEKKPGDLCQYLGDFTQEMLGLEQQPVTIGKHSFHINLHCFVCDAPARAFLKQVKGHTGYYGCEKCNQKGVWRNRMTFPSINAPKRTDEDIDDNHQIRMSPLRELSIGMVTGFPYDYMHMVCLGVMRRLLCYWVSSPVSKGLRLGPRAIQQISEKLLLFKEYIPREFARKCRSLSEMDRWKATEFHQFLLYSGIVSLRGPLSIALYNHFLLLFVAIFCLASPDFFEDHADYSHDLLCRFVTQCEDLYEKELVVYNVHGLIHLAEDVKKFGPLDTYSAFPFETFLGQLKRLVRKPQSTLQQIVRRLHEKRNLDLPIKRQKKISSFKFNVPEKKHFNGPIPRCGFHQFQQVQCKHFFLALEKGNNCVKISGSFFLIRNILTCENSGEVSLAVERFSKVFDYFSYPLKSSYLGIFLASNLTGHVETFFLSQVEKKLVILPYEDKFVLIPFCHE